MFGHTHTHTKNMSLISHKTSIFHYRNIFGNMLCLPVFLASEIDNSLYLVCVLYASNKILWNSIARKPGVGKFAQRMSRSLVQTCAVHLYELCISCKYIYRALQMRRLVRTYLVRTFSSLVQKEVCFFFKF